VTLPTRDFEEEDTLHPEDHVQPPPSAPTAVDTMVVAPGDLDTGDTAVAPAVPAAEEARVSFWRRLLVLLVIAALVALIVVLVVWGLAR
jgi:hypothetical protein